MSTRTVLTQLGLAAVVALGTLAVLPDNASAAKQNFLCRMKGVWSTSPNDPFEFDAKYVWDGGEDVFDGVYDNPGIAHAAVNGAAKSGVWAIVLTYTDDKHKGMAKKLIGSGKKDPVTHLINVAGTFKTFIGANDIKSDGNFVLTGTCH